MNHAALLVFNAKNPMNTAVLFLLPPATIKRSVQLVRKKAPSLQCRFRVYFGLERERAEPMKGIWGEKIDPRVSEDLLLRL